MSNDISVLYMDIAPFAGGAQRSFCELIREIPGEIISLFQGEGLAALQDGTFPGFRLNVCHWERNLSGFVQFMMDAVRSRKQLHLGFRTFSPDVVHVNTVRSALLLLGAGVIPKAPIFIHDRDLRVPKCVLPLLCRILQPRVIAISSAVAEKWAKHLPKERLHIVPNGFDFDRMRQVQPKVAFPENCFTVIQAADFEPWKRHALFMEAIAIAYEKDHSIRGIMKGRIRGRESSKYLNALKNEIDRRKWGNIIKLLPEDEPALPWISGSGMLASCSENEPFGRTAIEALVLGKLVVATEKAYATEICKSAGQGISLVASSPQALANAILKHKCFPPPDIRQLVKDFSITSLAEKIHELHKL